MRKFPFFSDKQSKDMWDEINNAKTKDDLRAALYTVCCRLQDLESYIEYHTHPKEKA